MTPVADNAVPDSDLIGDETGEASLAFNAIIDAHLAYSAMLQAFSLLRGEEDTVGWTPGLGLP
jgi:hypothetical protein